MAEEKKSLRKQLNKYFIIGAVIFTVIFTFLGLKAIHRSKEDGSDEVLENESSFNSLIHQDSINGSNVSLTDEQFLAGLDRIFPTDRTSDSAIRAAIAQIEQSLADGEVTADVRYFNNFGESGYCISTTSSLDKVKSLLDFSVCSEYYIQISDAGGIGIREVYKVDKDNLESRLVSGTDVGVQQDNTLIAELCDELNAQYNITDVVLTEQALLINSINLSTADLLNVFDYTYQWCLQNDCDRQIFLYLDNVLMAVTDETLRDEYYSSNYPIDELSAVFRLEYYSAKCFFSSTVQTLCDLYL